MKMAGPRCRIFGLLLWLAGSAHGLARANPLGLWVTFDDSAKVAQAMVRISEHSGRWVGHVVEVLDPAAGADPRCDRCPPESRGLPLKGLQIISNVNPIAQGNRWTQGLILDPEEGRFYRLELEYQEVSNELKVRGYWGPFWRTQVWRRPAGAG